MSAWHTPNLSEKQIEKIRDLARPPHSMPMKMIAQRFGISDWKVKRILEGMPVRRVTKADA